MNKIKALERELRFYTWQLNSYAKMPYKTLCLRVLLLKIAHIEDSTGLTQK